MPPPTVKDYRHGAECKLTQSLEGSKYWLVEHEKVKENQRTAMEKEDALYTKPIKRSDITIERLDI